VSTDTDDQYVVELRDKVVLSARDFKAGNIIFEMLTKNAAEITLEDICRVYDFSIEKERLQAEKLLQEAHEQKLSFVEINPSYGAGCVAMATSMKLVKRDWLVG
jgi:hypothetical protein